MAQQRHTGRADADRAWDLMGGRPGVKVGIGAWLDAHPRLVVAIGIAAVLAVVGTILLYVLIAAGTFGAPSGVSPS